MNHATSHPPELSPPKPKKSVPLRATATGRLAGAPSHLPNLSGKIIPKPTSDLKCSTYLWIKIDMQIATHCKSAQTNKCLAMATAIAICTFYHPENGALMQKESIHHRVVPLNVKSPKPIVSLSHLTIYWNNETHTTGNPFLISAGQKKDGRVLDLF